MRILVVHNFYRRWGGEDEAIRTLTRILEAHGHEVRLFSADSGERVAGVGEKLRLGLGALYSFPTARRLGQALKNFSPDVVHVQNVFPLLSPSVYWALDRARVPVVQVIQNFRFLCPNGLAYTQGSVCFRCKSGNTLSAIRFRCLHGEWDQSAAYALVIGVHRALRTFERAGHFLPVNHMLAGLLREEFPRVPVTVLANCVDTRALSPRAGFEPSFVYLGRLAEEKGVRTLIQAVARAERCVLHVVGEGPLGDELKMEADRVAPGRVTFHGFVTGEARFDLVRRATALVMPSLSHDACPVAVLEAMALGVPVVASRRGGLPDLVRDAETGYLFEAGDAGQLSRRLQELCDRPETARRMGAAARRRAEDEYDVEVFYRRLTTAYEAARAARVPAS